LVIVVGGPDVEGFGEYDEGVLDIPVSMIFHRSFQ
jgi:hypothetical protein